MAGGKGRESVYLVYGEAGKPAHSVTWRIGSSSDSFYIVPLLGHGWNPRMSLHAPNNTKGNGKLFFKMQIDNKEEFDKDLADGALGFMKDLPMKFTGRRVQDGVTHAITIRTTFDAVNRLPAMETYPNKGNRKGYSIPLPRNPGMAMDVELYYCEKSPIVPGEALFRSANGLPSSITLGKNSAGGYLTIISHERQVSLHPTPPVSNPGSPVDRNDECRGIGMATDLNGVMWIVEQRTSRMALESATREYFESQ